MKIIHATASNVRTYNLALGNSDGFRKDNIYCIWGETPENDQYLFTTIDQFVLNHEINRIDLIKIDVDSFDFEVLMGAEKSIEIFDPYIMIELNRDALKKRNYSPEEVIKWLINRGYLCTFVFDQENYLFKRNWSIQDNIQTAIQFSKDLNIEEISDLYDDSKYHSLNLKIHEVDISQLEFVLFKKYTGSELIDFWQYNLYGDNEPITNENVIQIIPSATQDHIATPFIKIPKNKVNELSFRVMFEFPEYCIEQKIICSIQNNEYKNLIEFPISIKKSDRVFFKSLFIHSNERHIRFVFNSKPGNDFYLPISIQIEIPCKNMFHKFFIKIYRYLLNGIK